MVQRKVKNESVVFVPATPVSGLKRGYMNMNLIEGSGADLGIIPLNSGII